MYTGSAVRPPLFEVGVKAYCYGEPAVALARAMEQLGRRYGITPVFTPQLVDIHRVAQATQDLLVFAPHLDPVGIGRGSGSVLAEAVKAAGAAGVLLNHAERRMTLGQIAQAIRRADEVGLLSMVCADSADEAAALAYLGPNMIMAEPPDLIGGAQSVAKVQREFIVRTLEAVRRINPEILIFNSAGIRSGDDAAAVIRFGADGTGSTSGVLTAPDPVAKLDEMMAAVSAAWRERGGR